MRRAALLGAVAALSVATAGAQEPANTLMDLRRQFGACLERTPPGPAGSRVTIVFMMSLRRPA